MARRGRSVQTVLQSPASTNRIGRMEKPPLHLGRNPGGVAVLSIAEKMTTASTNSISVMAKENSSRKQPSRVAILGFGTVGSSVARILSENPPGGLELTHICNRDVERK